MPDLQPPRDPPVRTERYGAGAEERAEHAPRRAWHALEAEGVVAALDTDADAGLGPAEVRDRLARHGPNELGRDEPRRDLDILLAQFRSPLIGILVVALAVTLLIDEPVDAAVIAVVLVLNAIIGFTQERKADRSVHALSQLAAQRSRTVREGREQEVASTGLVPGDVVLLASGTRVPADLRLVRTATLEIDESLLTGESLATSKTVTVVPDTTVVADRSNMAFMGSVVTSGRGRGVVVATAAGTELGAIADSIRREVRPRTPLQERMRRFADLIGVVVVCSTLVVFAVGVALGRPVGEMFLTAVALAVAVVPEGLPVAFTVAMALGVHRMAQRNVIIRSLPAVETLGSTDTIGSDKTGTLTANRMTVRRVWTADGWVHLGVPGGPPDPQMPHAVDHLAEEPDGVLADVLHTAVLSNEADLEVEDGEITAHHGDPTESALLEAAHGVGRDPARIRGDGRVLAAVAFESELRYSYVVVDEDGPVLRLKGAPERVIELCTSVQGRHGSRALVVDDVHTAVEVMAELGLRVLATAERRLDLAADDIDPEAPPRPGELTLTGLIGMQDPPRPGVEQAIARCRRGGIRVVMITGDHAVTARAIARDVGLDAERVLTGVDLERMDDEALETVVAKVDVFARVSPEHKLRVVRALRANGQVVAVTGDGVNDGPALKAADIGVAMGRGGTDVAREASDMVLTDDAFPSIANAVEEGRVVFDNVRKVTYFLLSTGAAAIVAITASLVVGLPLPYTPAALLWLNVVTNGLQDVALAFDRGEPDVLDRSPRPRGEGIVSRTLWVRVVLTGTAMAVGSLWLFVWATEAGRSLPEARGAALTTLVAAMVAHVYTARSERRSVLVTGVSGNRFLLAASVLAVFVHVSATYWSPTQRILQVAPTPPSAWWRIALVTLAVVAVSEVHKFVRARHRRRARAGASGPG
jgi:magnesium-transporting ATPase (P-type)